MDGLGRRMPLPMGAFLIASISIAGLPPMGGMWSKWHLTLGAASAEQLIFVAVLMISGLLNIAYLLPVVARGFFCASEDANGPNTAVRTTSLEAPVSCLVALSLTAAGCIILFFYADRIQVFLQPIVDG